MNEATEINSFLATLPGTSPAKSINRPAFRPGVFLSGTMRPIPPPRDRSHAAYAADLAAVREAAARIAGFVHRTPVMTSETLDRLAGRAVFFKCENLQKTGAFKYRGATNAVRKLDAAPPPAASSRTPAATTPRPWPWRRGSAASPPTSSCRGPPRR